MMNFNFGFGDEDRPVHKGSPPEPSGWIFIAFFVLAALVICVLIILGSVVVYSPDDASLLWR